LMAVTRAQAIPTNAKTWYEKKLLGFKTRMDRAGIGYVANYLNDLAKSYTMNIEQLFNHLCRLALYMNGSLDRLR
jgi:hypothetical protein